MSSDDGSQVVFYIGHYEQEREYAVTDDVFRHAQQECDYDMLTAPITTGAFNERVLSAIAPYVERPAATTLRSFKQLSLSNYIPSPTLGSLNYPQDTLVVPSSTTSQIIFTSSPWIDLASPDPVIADVSNQVLQLEMQYAAFCGATNVIVPAPRMYQGHYPPEGVSQYARALQEALKSGPYVQISVLLDMYGQDNAPNYQNRTSLAHYARQGYRWNMSSGDGSAQDRYHTWDVWNAVRTVCKYNARLSVALTVPPTLPPKSLQSRWYSEPLRILHFPASSFQQANTGISLNEAYMPLLQKYMGLRNPPWILLSGGAPLPGVHGTGLSPSLSHPQSNPIFSENDPTPAQAANLSMSHQNGAISKTHLDCMRRMQNSLSPKSPMEVFGTGYQDFLQNPLQPLSDNLESITYEVFEKDPVKYDWYERAMVYALRDWQARSKPASGPSGRVVLAVVGAGRGPLVGRAISASEKTGVEIDLWALEKNPNAFVLLQKHNQESWNGKVNLIQSDMRSWAGPFDPNNFGSQHTQYCVDILVSELLGSFGDNELSPECLDGVQHLLNPTHGLSIPSSYSSYLAPVAAPKLHADIMARTTSGDTDAGQTPCVVFLQAVDFLSTSRPPPGAQEFRPLRFWHEPLPTIHLTWEFEHPSPAFQTKTSTQPPDNRHNKRFRKLDFHCMDRGVCHGLAGYFETVLYDPGPNEDGTESVNKVELSTNPLTMELKSPDMISWFPIYFPLKAPLYFPDNTLLSISIWRQMDGRKVWYEWMVESYMLLEFDSKLGNHKVERLGATDLHSSISSGCLL